MKKLLVFALAAISMVACMKEETTLLPQGDAISFDSAFIDNATRAAVDPSTVTATLNGFNVWGFVKEYDGTIFDGTEVKKVDGAWGYQGTQYWVPNQPFYFAALAPMNSANWDVTLATGDAAKLGLGTVAFTNVEGTEDLLYAKEMMQSKGLNEDNGPVKFQFQHLLSKVKFTFTNGFPTETASIKVTNVKMEVPAEAQIDLAQADYAKAWTLGNGTTTLAFGDVETLAYTQRAEVANERLTIPAADTQDYLISFHVELFMGKQSVYEADLTSTVSGYELAMGHAYNFSAVINAESLQLENIVFDVEVVEDWVDAGEQDVYVGETVAVADATELMAAIADPEVSAVVLTENIDLGSTTITRAEDEAVVVEKQYFTIDGNGKTLTYNGSNRVIDFVKGDVVKNATIKNLTINITSSYCERGINFNNANGSLLIENVTFEGTAPTYAVNFPSVANGADVTIKNSYLAGKIALNVWGENMTINAYNTEFVSVDNTEVEDYVAVKLNNDGSNAAEGTIINIEGGKIIARNEKGEPNRATANATNTGVINVSDSTEVVGVLDVEQVAIVDYGTTQFYGFPTLQSAIDKVVENNNGRVKVTKNIELTQSVNVPNGATVVIDLNGKTITGYDASDKSYGLINNRGNLTVKNGTLTLKAEKNREWNAYSSVISNNPGGNLVVENVTIEHLGGTDMAYGIDNLTNGKGTSAIVTVNEGAVVKSTYRAVRQFLNGIEATNELTVNAGAVIEGANKSIWMQDPSKNANTGKLVVNEGATLKGDVYLFVTAGSTEWPVEVSIAESALVGESQVLTGNVPAGYIVTKENGAYVVAEVTVANDQAALNDAVANANVDDIYLASGNYEMPAVTGKDFTIYGGEDVVITVTKPNMSGSDIIFDGVTIKGSGYSTGVQHVNTVTYRNAKVVGEMCLYGEKVTFEGCTFELNGQYIWTYSAKEVEFINCVFNTTGKAILIYNEGNGANNVTVTGCTFNATAGAKAGAIANQNCAAIEIDNFQSSGVGAAHKLTTANNTFGANFSGEWRIKNYVAGGAINVNGVDYTQIAVDGKLMTIDSNRNVTVL
ncbi:MAG: fimbrillin family protein [Alistipes sp.]|nr:fimbrillin family protein [Alistipes sp.]